MLSHPGLVPRGGERALHVVVVEKEVSSRLQGGGCRPDTVFLLLGRRQLVEAVPAQQHHVESGGPGFRDDVAAAEGNALLDGGRQLAEAALQAHQQLLRVVQAYHLVTRLGQG